jgi:prepilin-type N-terminal cleavage/methylation domain-containing protein
MKRIHSRKRSGFTLIEVMLTLLIMAGIMVTITEILTATRRSRDTIHNIQERLLAGPAILDRLERDLRATFVLDRDPRDFLRIRDRVLSGFDADSIDFVCSVDSLVPFRENDGEHFRRADFNEVGYHLRLSPGSDEFIEMYRREDLGVDEEPFLGGTFAFLHDRVKAFDIKVYDEDGPEAEPLDSWGVSEDDEEIGLPWRLEIELTIELAPRLVREQLSHDRRTMTYKRVFRFPESLLLAQERQIIPVIPNMAAAGTDDGTGGTADSAGSGDPGGIQGGGGGAPGLGGRGGGGSDSGSGDGGGGGDGGGNPFGGGGGNPFGGG